MNRHPVRTAIVVIFFLCSWALFSLAQEINPNLANDIKGEYLRDYLGNKIKIPISIVGKINSAGFMNGYYIEVPSLKNKDNLPGIMIANYDDELLDILHRSNRICRFNGLTNNDKSIIFITSIDNKKYTGKLRSHLLQNKQSNGMKFTLNGQINMSAVIGFMMQADNGINVSFGEELPAILEEILKKAYKTNRKVTIIGEMFPKEGIRGSNYFHVNKIGFEGDSLLPVSKYDNKPLLSGTLIE
jgi:hypothetical protein